MPLKEAKAFYMSASTSSEYRVWQALKNRCCNPKSEAFNEYGGRGITVCERWLHSFDNFLEDVGSRPSILHTIERKNNNQGYNKENCKWATKQEQGRNKRNNIYIQYNGTKRLLIEVCEELGFPYRIIAQRHRRGWKDEELFTLRMDQLLNANYPCFTF